MNSNLDKLHRQGFSLLELILVLGLMALFSTITVVNTNNLFQRPDQTLSIKESLMKAVREARFLAIKNKIQVRLCYQKESRTLDIQDEYGQSLNQIPLTFENEDLEISFNVILPGSNLNADSKAPPQDINFIRFGPDRSSQRSEIVISYGIHEEHIQIDPFSDLIISTKK